MTTKYSAKGLLVAKDNPQLLLLIRERLQNGEIIYDLPGGKIELGETPRQALERELFEEIGIKNSEIVKEIGKYDFSDDRLHVKVICHTFLCKIDAQVIFDLAHNPAQHENIIEAKWLTSAEILSANYPGIVPSLRKLIEKIQISQP